ncbi:alcohol dehydrogenase catalytic domain-containing protein [Microbacterium marinilacus]|uniref:Zinc-binding dehydrogenase n=1 Tax=Microbacterium marinilacus TaxID=415209 RepID=A0ABP7BQK0_9MICO|nr:zinc-binding dehydrogenase [Microbacterium marinilacus]MBY0690463.1 zinc-binding dehydrogenase [Microbacterium marinilacus]
MKAVVIREFGETSGMEVAEVPTPSLGDGKVLVKTEAIGVGGVDAAIRRGTLGDGYPRDMIPGGEVAGTIVEVGPGVPASWRGTRVWAHTGTSGGYAEYAAARLEDVTALPDGLDAVEAVALGSAATVAHFALEHAHFQTGEALLVRGAAGSIGIAAVELSRQRGASSIAVTTSSRERGERLISLGASQILDRNGQSPTGGTEEFDVILDIVGGAAVPSFVDRLASNGRMVLVGAVAGFPPAEFGMSIMRSFQRSRSIAAFSLASVDAEKRDRVRAVHFEAAVRGDLHAVVHERMPLERAARAHDAMDAGNVFGRIVLTS